MQHFSVISAKPPEVSDAIVVSHWSWQGPLVPNSFVAEPTTIDVCGKERNAPQRASSGRHSGEVTGQYSLTIGGHCADGWVQL